jgi:23S rRNA (cytosine1962-C5)-methyltransferase
MNERISVGHPWIFGNELQPIPPDSIKAGSLVDVYTIDKRWIGIGYFNPKSQIAVRLLTRKKEPVDAHFFYKRILDAWQYRQKLGYYENCRLVFGEADELPALIIDKFNDYFVIQTLAL